MYVNILMSTDQLSQGLCFSVRLMLRYWPPVLRDLNRHNPVQCKLRVALGLAAPPVTTASQQGDGMMDEGTAKLRSPCECDPSHAAMRIARGEAAVYNGLVLVSRDESAHWVSCGMKRSCVNALGAEERRDCDSRRRGRQFAVEALPSAENRGDAGGVKRMTEPPNVGM